MWHGNRSAARSRQPFPIDHSVRHREGASSAGRPCLARLLDQVDVRCRTVIAFNVGLLLVGVVGGALVGVGLAVTSRRRADATAALLEHGERVAATVLDVTSEGAQLQWRTVRLRCDDGREVRDRLDSMVASRLAVQAGERRMVVRSRSTDDPGCRVVDALGTEGNSLMAAAIAGAVIVALGVAAAFAL